MPKVSVVLPVFNAEKYIKSSIDSILGQTFKDFEVIVIDDGSTDQSLKILQSITDPRLKISINEQNLGISKSLNKGIQLAVGEFIARMDGDDLCSPQRFQKQVGFLEAHPDIDVVGSWFKLFGDTAPQVIRSPEKDLAIKAALLFDSALGHPTVMMRKSSLQKLEIIYNPIFNKAEDYELWTRASTIFRYANIPEVLLEYRIHRAQTGSTSGITQKSLGDQIRKNYLEKLGIQLSQNSTQVHRLLCHGNLGKISPSQYSLIQEYHSDLVTTSPNAEMNSALKIEFTQQISALYYRNFLNFSLRCFIRKMKWLDSRSIPFSKKIFWILRSPRELLSRMKHGSFTIQRN